MEQAQFPYPANTAKGQKQTHKKGLTPKADWRSFPLLSHFFHCLRGLVSKVFISNKRNRQPQLLNTGVEQPLFHRVRKHATPPHSTIQNDPLSPPTGAQRRTRTSPGWPEVPA